MNPTSSSLKSSRKFSGYCLAVVIAFVLAGCQGMNHSSTTTTTTTSTAPVSVSLNQSAVSLAAGGTSQFTATVKNTSNTSVTWSVNSVAGGNTSLGTVSATGLYTAPSLAGSFTVSATSVADTAASAKASVVVGTLGAILPATALILPGATQQFQATVEGFSNTAVNWSVDQIAGGNSSVGTITSGGLYTGPAQNGPHTITAVSAADSSVTASASVTVTALSISPTTATLIGGISQTFTPALPDVSSPTITWTATGGTISNGVYTAPSAPGTYTVTATDSTLTASSSVTVFAFSISPTSSTVAPTGTLDFTATLQGLSNDAVAWSVDGTSGGNSSVGTINSSGVYTAPSAVGSYVVTASSVANSAFSRSASVVVVNPTQTSVLTYHNDLARDGAYLNEVTLTPQNVNSTSFGKLVSYPVDGQIYAQPLYVPQLSIGGGTYDVVFVATQNNYVYAFNADATSSATAQTFWTDGPSILGPAVIVNDTGGPYPSVGVLSTPVIDPTTNTMYLVSEASPNSPTPFRLFGLDLTTGAIKLGPDVISATYSGDSLETFCFQRMGLALNPVTNWIYIAFGDCDNGWVVAYDKQTLTQQAVFEDTNGAEGGGLWSGGGAPAIDSSGNVYVETGTDYDDEWISAPPTYTQTGYNDSFLNLNPTTLAVQSSFSPDNNYTLSANDADLGSGSPTLVPGNSQYEQALIGGGKDGNVFVVNPLDMGGFSSTNDVIETLQTGTQQYNNIFSTPVYWNENIYYHDNRDVLKAYSWNPNNSTPLAGPTSEGSVIYTAHGATASLSANGNNNAIVWDTDNSAYTSCGCDPASSGPLVLHAYDATNLANQLYNSSQAASGRDTAGLALKFTVPTIANGKVFVPTATELDIYGLLNP
jgi:hypothetical protein